MKILRIILFVVLGLVLVAGAMVAFAPTDLTVERSVVIDAPKDLVYQKVSSLKAMDAWSPWSKRDPNMESSYEGEDGAVGSINRWSGNEEVGVGEQEITAVNPPHGIETQIRFKEPWESQADATVKLATESPTSTRVTWGFDSEMPRPANAFGLFMDMDAAIGADFEEGLGELKKLCEEETSQILAKNQVQEVQFPGRTFVAVRKKLKMEEITPFYGENFGAIFGALQGLGLEMDGMPSGVAYSYDADAGEIDLAAAIGVKSDDPVSVEGYETITIPAGKALLIDYYGPYGDVYKAHHAMEVYLQEKGLKYSWPVVEEYANDPTGLDPSEVLTKVYYILE